MTAALELASKQLPADKDTPEARKEIANKMIDCAKSGRRSYIDFQRSRR
jgi:hypothetical protein